VDQGKTLVDNRNLTGSMQRNRPSAGTAGCTNRSTGRLATPEVRQRQFPGGRKPRRDAGIFCFGRHL